MKTSLFSRAIQLSALGYSIIPLKKDKRPILLSWKQYQTTAATDEEIEKWFDMYPEANIGIATGKVSGITVIDLDTAGDIAPRTPFSTFPSTYTVKTPSGGYHLYYQYTPGLTISANAYPQYPHLDIRSDGGYVVAPYSTTAYEKEGKPSGGLYEVVNDRPLAPFPAHLFPTSPAKERRTLTSKLGKATGGRNDSITSFIGSTLHSTREEEWETEVWTAVQMANNTFTPPLPFTELRATFESIVKKETERRTSLILSPIQIEGNDTPVNIKIRKNGNGQPYKDMANVLAVLQGHPYFMHAIRYNIFRQEVEFNNKPLEEGDILKIQYFMQTQAELSSISKDSVHSAIMHYANMNSYDEVLEWLNSLAWDATPRLHNWLHQAAHVDDDEYHAGIGAQWFMGMIRRLLIPGSVFDHVLLLIGAQGIGKTSFFRILGGKWYKSYTGAMDNKDFFLALRGAMIVDLDEGAALYKSEAIKIKSIITETHDEYRAPYDRVMKKYPRRFVFSMSTNDTEPFRDSTGNRRYWAVDAPGTINFNWLTDNRDQLFAEAYHCFKNNIALPEVPMLLAVKHQEEHLPEDPWTDLVMEILQRSNEYCEGDEIYFTTIGEMYKSMFPREEDLSRLGRSQEMRIGTILEKAGLRKVRVMIEGERKNRWMLKPERALQLQERNAPTTAHPLDDEFK